MAETRAKDEQLYMVHDDRLRLTPEEKFITQEITEEDKRQVAELLRRKDFRKVK